jgi:hypothetical protein
LAGDLLVAAMFADKFDDGLGEKRDDLLRRARQYETAANIDSWVTSRGLDPPKKPN